MAVSYRSPQLKPSVNTFRLILGKPVKESLAEQLLAACIWSIDSDSRIWGHFHEIRLASPSGHRKRMTWPVLCRDPIGLLNL